MIDSGINLLSLLKLRDLKILYYNSLKRVLLPKNKKYNDGYMNLLKHYSFRLLLRDIIANKESFAMDSLAKYCSKKTVMKYLDFLLQSGIIRQLSPDSFSLVSGVNSFGHTFEWYISEILSSEFSCDVLFNVSFEKNWLGGDFDVIGLAGHHLFYMETKTSPPSQAADNQLEIFLSRTKILLPNFSIFYIDTTLRIKSRIVERFEDMLVQKAVSPSRGLFHFGSRIFVINSSSPFKSVFPKIYRIFLKGL